MAEHCLSQLLLYYIFNEAFLSSDDVYGRVFGPKSPSVLFIFLLAFGHHVNFKGAQGRKIIIPTAVPNTVETLINILLIYL